MTQSPEAASERHRLALESPVLALAHESIPPAGRPEAMPAGLAGQLGAPAASREEPAALGGKPQHLPLQSGPWLPRLGEQAACLGTETRDSEEPSRGPRRGQPPRRWLGQTVPLAAFWSAAPAGALLPYACSTGTPGIVQQVQAAAAVAVCEGFRQAVLLGRGR